MDLTRYVDDLQRRFAQAADLGGEETQVLAQRLAAPLDAAVRLVLLDALCVATGEISADLAPGSVDLRLRGGEPEFVVALPDVGPRQESQATAPPEAPAPLPRDAEDATTTRTTLRLPDHLKVQVEAAATAEGVSVNTWLVRAVAAALAPGTAGPSLAAPGPGATPAGSGPTAPARGRRTSGTHLTGWVR